MYAIIQDGGKQYKVMPGKSVELEKKELDTGTPVEFTQVLYVHKDDEILVGNPIVPGMKVKGIVEQHHLGDKIIIYKFKKNGNSHTKKGHRQIHTRVRICQIVKE